MKNGKNKFWGNPPPQKKKKKLNWGGVQIFFVKNKKNQSCSKLHEMARKLVEIDFIGTQPQKLGYLTFLFLN